MTETGSTDGLKQERLDKRRLAFQQAARELFIEQGYERTTLAEVVDRAGGSLATLYKLFGNKEGLLDAVLAQSRDLGHSVVERVAAQGLPPAETLHRLGAELNAIYLDPPNLSVVRIVIGRSICDVDFARSFFDLSQMKAKLAMRDLFRRWGDKGIALNGDPEMLADLFLSLLVFDFQIQAISHGFMAPPTEAQVRERTDFFLRGAGLAD